MPARPLESSCLMRAAARIVKYTLPASPKHPNYSERNVVQRASVLLVTAIASARPTRQMATPSGKAPSSRVGKLAVEHDEDAAVVGAADQPAEGLLQLQPGQHLVVGAAAEGVAARPVQQGRPRPRHPVEDDQPQRAAGHVDAVAHRVGAEQAGVLLGAEDVDQRADVERIDVLRQQRLMPASLERPRRSPRGRAQPADRGEQAERRRRPPPGTARDRPPPPGGRRCGRRR